VWGQQKRFNPALRVSRKLSLGAKLSLCAYWSENSNVSHLYNRIVFWWYFRKGNLRKSAK
ncbi:hypothetical protein, partial [Klebsiella oxytoca]|uniref:hypothetical protein n=1 Tax=Klebsiella oxytoca TaxID=571 RepID=UPI003F7DA61E